MSRRSYGQFCGLVRAAELVAERWALLIVRDLLVSPKRYTDLLNGLPGIPTNVLAARLKQLEEGGVVRRRLDDRAVLYELTEYGQELEAAVLALGRWGARMLTEPAPDEVVTPDSMVMAFRSTFRPEAAQGLTASFEVRLGEIALHVHVEDGEAHVDAGAAPAPDLVIETGPAIKALLAGELTPAEARANGSVRLTGDPRLLDRFAALFRI